MHCPGFHGLTPARGKVWLAPSFRLKQFAKLIDREAGTPHDRAHRDRVDGIIARYRHDAPAVGHHDVLALPPDVEASLLQGGPRRDDLLPATWAWLDGDLDVASLGLRGQFRRDLKVLANGIDDVLQGLGLGGTLRQNPGRPGTLTL